MTLASRKLYHSMRRRGILGTVHHGVGRLFRPAPPPWTRPEAQQKDDEDFDRAFGVQTAGVIQLKNLDVQDGNWVYGIDYEPTPGPVFQDMMARTALDFEKYTFVDFGSGKGKALLLAAGYGFKKVIGVEISEELCREAEANIANFRGPMISGSIHAVCCDAEKFEMPDGPLYLYFYNPFDEAVMSNVIANIKTEFARQVRPIYSALVYPRLEHLFLESNFEPVIQNQDFAIFRLV